jgi:hypothetical protein
LFSFVGWEGEDEIRLKVMTRIGDQFVDVPARLVRTAGGWKREGPPQNEP